MAEEVMQIIVLPEDGLCEGCGESLGEEVFETDDMIVLCKGCWNLCVAENNRENSDGE